MLDSGARANYFPHVLFAAYVLLFIALGIEPRDRAVWWAENIPIVLLAGSLAILTFGDKAKAPSGNPRYPLDVGL
jgi:uncharacterized membrane protein YjdF